MTPAQQRKDSDDCTDDIAVHSSFEDVRRFDPGEPAAPARGLLTAIDTLARNAARRLTTILRSRVSKVEDSPAQQLLLRAQANLQELERFAGASILLSGHATGPTVDLLIRMAETRGLSGRLWVRTDRDLLGFDIRDGKIVGSLDEIRIWGIARTNDEIAAAKDAVLDGLPAGLVAYLKADDGSGSTLADASGNGLDAQQRNVTEPIVRGTIDHVGQRVLHTFTLTAATRVYVDSLENNSALLWSLAGPRGSVVADRRFDQTDSQNGLSAFDLPAGDYTFTVRGSADYTGAFTFGLLDLDNAQALTPGTIASGAGANAEPAGRAALRLNRTNQ